jgi:hypothetical protein
MNLNDVKNKSLSRLYLLFILFQLIQAPELMIVAIKRLTKPTASVSSYMHVQSQG